MLTRIIDDNDLINGVIHEIKNPIALIKANIELISLECKDFTRHFEIINRELNYLEELTCDYLTTRQNITMGEVYLSEILDDMIFDYSETYSNIKFNFFFENKAFVNGDYKMLKMILRNVYKNCVESINKRIKNYPSEDFKGVISTHLSVNHDTIKIIIKDNGIGQISPLDFRKNGIGLQIIEKLVALHEGDFKIYKDALEGIVQEITLKTML